MKTKKNDDKKPLSTDISGKYKYNQKRNEYICLRKFGKDEKKVYNIRLGNHKPCLWVNHRDYTAIQCNYDEALQHYEFTFNDVSYQIPIVPNFDDKIGYYVTIKKV